jgi:hypothetical protein
MRMTRCNNYPKEQRLDQERDLKELDSYQNITGLIVENPHPFKLVQQVVSHILMVSSFANCYQNSESVKISEVPDILGIHQGWLACSCLIRKAVRAGTMEPTSASQAPYELVL